MVAQEDLDPGDVIDAVYYGVAEVLGPIKQTGAIIQVVASRLGINPLETGPHLLKYKGHEVGSFKTKAYNYTQVIRCTPTEPLNPETSAFQKLRRELSAKILDVTDTGDVILSVKTDRDLISILNFVAWAYSTQQEESSTG